jgi:hypothetical protein
MKRTAVFFALASSLWISHASALDCANAVASQTLLWPPNHKLVAIEITNLTEPGETPATVVITAITQDEPVNGLGDGDTGPDGFGIGTSTAQLRAERSGLENGRVYGIAFTATTDDGEIEEIVESEFAAEAVQAQAICEGFVVVGVQHERRPGSTPIDDGQLFDSTVLP